MLSLRGYLSKSDAGTEVDEQTDSEGSKLRFLADSKLERNVAPGELAAEPQKVISIPKFNLTESLEYISRRAKYSI